MSREVISDVGEAARRGMYGSPTLLIDEVDLFAEPGQTPSMSCRLYRYENGKLSGAPSLAQLREAVERAAEAAGASDLAWLESAGRSGQGRRAPAERGLRAVLQAVLRSFVSTVAAPPMSSLGQYAAPFEAPLVLAELADGDFLWLDQAGEITAAYPFSAAPTPHRVQISDRASVFAMCAIDALGIAAMTGLPVVIESADLSTGEPVTVKVDGASAIWDPVTAVVYVGRTGDGCAGPSASVSCGYMNFFATPAATTAWAASQPENTGCILDQAGAVDVAVSIFGQLLS